MPTTPQATEVIRVHLQDQGQDFLWIDVKPSGLMRGRIIDAQPFQGWLWKGKRVDLNSLKAGKQIVFCSNRKWGFIKYPITRVHRIAEPV